MLPRPEINFQRTPVTLIIAAVAVAVEIVCNLDPDRRFGYYNNWLGILPCIWEGELWRPFTSTLMHVNFVHAACNIYALLIFGPLVENRLGSYRYLGVVVLLGFVSMMLEYVVGSYHESVVVMIVGLSGIIYGLFGMVLVGRRRWPEAEAVCDRSMVGLMVGWFIFCILTTYTGQMRVANIAHGAGFVFGALYGLVACDVRNRVGWTILATLSTLVVFSTLVYCPGHYWYELIRARRTLWIPLPAHRSVKVDVAPVALLVAVPDAGFLATTCHRLARGVQLLSQPHVADDGRVAEHSHVRLGDGGIPRSLGLFQVEVEPVEVHSLHEVPTALRLERGDGWVAQALVGLPVGLADRVQQSLGQVEQFGLGDVEVLHRVVSHGQW
jgi:rhomboid protease GluP